MRNNLALNILRWIIAVPAGVLVWFAANHAIGTAFGILHGFDRVGDFWEAPDMDGVPIIGFTWFGLLDMKDWDTALTQIRGTVNTVGLYSLGRKPRKVAIVAVARKLVVLANAIAKSGKPWNSTIGVD